MNVKFKNMEYKEELQTSEYWHALYYPHLIIKDPDGWDRSNYNFSFYEEKVTFEEYKQRLFRSTVEVERFPITLPVGKNTKEFYEFFGTVIMDADETRYYFMPFWLERKKDSNDFLMHSLGNLPDKLRDLIKEHRL